MNSNEKTLLCLTGALTDEEGLSALFDRLEAWYLLNQGDHELFFAILGMPMPSNRRRTEGDLALFSYAAMRVDALSRRYGSRFAFFVPARKRARTGYFPVDDGDAMEKLCRFLKKGEDTSLYQVGSFSAVKDLLLTDNSFLPDGRVRALISRMRKEKRTAVFVKGRARRVRERTCFAELAKGAEGFPRSLCLIDIDRFLSEPESLTSFGFIEDLRVPREAPPTALVYEAEKAKDLCVLFRLALHGIRETARKRKGSFLRLLSVIWSAVCPIAFLLLLFIGFMLCEKIAIAALFAVAATALLSLFGTTEQGKRELWAEALRRIFFRIACLAYEAFLSFSCLGKMLTSRTFIPPPRKGQGHLDDYILRFSPSMMLGLLFFLLPSLTGKLLGLLWMSAPFLFYLLSKEKRETRGLCSRDKTRLMIDLRHMWGFYRDKTENGLPPSFYEVSPRELLSESTTPRDIAMYLLAMLTMRDLGAITSEELSSRSRAAADAIALFPKWRGLLFSSYHMRSASRETDEIKASDAGLFATALYAFCAGVREYAKESPTLADNAKLLSETLRGMELSALYDPARRLFHRSYHMNTDSFSSAYHESFFDEARLLSFVCAARGEISLESYTAFPFGWERETAEAFFFPELFLPSSHQTERELSIAVKRAKRASVKRRFFGKNDRFFGRGESAYFSFDSEMRYCVSCLGERDVIVPHALFFMAMKKGDAAMEMLGRLRELGVYGKYGFYDALDLNKSRVGEGYAVIKTYFSAHLGMSILASGVLLLGEKMKERFLRFPWHHAAAFVLAETAPPCASVRPQAADIMAPSVKPLQTAEPALAAPSLLHPEVALISNGKTRIFASSSGHILAENGNLTLSGSEFELYSLGDGLSVLCDVDGCRLPTVPLARGEEGIGSSFVFGTRSGSLIYRGTHTVKGKSLETVLRLYVFPDKELFRVTLTLIGAYQEARAVIAFSPALLEKGYEREAVHGERDEEMFLFSRGSRLFAVRADPVFSKASFSDGHFHGESVILGKKQTAVFLFGAGDDREELFYRLTFLEKEALLRRKTGILRDLQYGASGSSRSPELWERKLLSGMCFGEIRPRTENFSYMEPSVFARYGLSPRTPLLLARCSSEHFAELSELLSLFKYMCIRGVRFTLFLLHFGNEEEILRAIRKKGCESFLGVALGIIVADGDRLSPMGRFSLETAATSVFDLSHAVSLMVPRENDAAVCPETEHLLRREPVRMPEHSKDLHIPRLHLFGTENFRTALSNVTLGQSFSGEHRLTPRGDALFLRLYEKNGKRFCDHDLAAVSSDAVFYENGAGYFGELGGLRYEVKLFAVGGFRAKKLTVHFSCEKEQRASLLYFHDVPPRDARLYRIRKGKGGLFSKSLSEKTSPTLFLFSQNGDRVFTDSAALRTDGAVHRGEADAAAVAASVSTVGKRVFTFGFFAFSSERELAAERKAFEKEILPIPIGSAKLFCRQMLYHLFKRDLDGTVTLRPLLFGVGEEGESELLLASVHQFEAGDVSTAFTSGKALRCRGGTDGLWLVFAVHSHVKRTGSTDLLEKRLPYLVSSPMERRERVREEDLLQTGYREPIFCHLERAIAAVAPENDGERFFLLLALFCMEELASLLGRSGEVYLEKREALSRQLREKYGND